MKKFVLLVLSLCILLAVTGCSNAPKDMLDESEYYAYQNGEMYLDPKDAIDENGTYKFSIAEGTNENFETKRGLKYGSSISQVKELYGDIKILPINGEKMTSITEYLESDEEIKPLVIFMYKYDGKNAGKEEFFKDHADLFAMIYKGQEDKSYREEALEMIEKTHDIENRGLLIAIEDAKVSEIIFGYDSPQNFRATALD